MKKKPTLVLSGSTLALLLALTACGEKKADPPEGAGPESAQGAILEAVQKTVDAANERTSDVEEAADAVTK